MALHVFILAGQSNMEGKGSIQHLEQLLKDPSTAAPYQHFRSGKEWAKRENVDIKFLEKEGKLTVGYGVPANRFGPELEFGWVVGNALQRVLLIKCAWGGSSLAIDWRPPSSGTGSYPQVKPLGYGARYRDTLRIIQETLAKEKDYTLSGLVWFQGFNDVIDAKKTDEYEANLVNFIQDIRADLDTPKLPVIVGELGMQGLEPEARCREKHLRFRHIQKSVTERAEFKDNTLFVRTAPYVIKDKEAFGGGYHYYGRTDTFFHIGHAFGEGMLRLMEKTLAENEPVS